MSQNIILLLSLVLLLGYTHGNALPRVNNATAVNVVSSGNTSCGHVTNVIIQGGREGEAGPQGDRGERGPTGPPGPPGPAASSSGGLSYTRWGRTTCPTTQGTQLLYQGVMVGSHHRQAGNANFLCLHNQPQFLRTTAGLQAYRGRLHGTEYEFLDHPPAFSNMHRHDAPCSVCYTPRRSTIITIPGRITCPSTWTREYYGYLMGEGQNNAHKSRVSVCVDLNPESVPGSAGHTTTSLLHFIETTCSGIRCPPYSNGAEITCVVCTK